jgi:hypothetical protein
MSQPPKSVQKVVSIRLASSKTTLILEGQPDRNVYEIWLGKLSGSASAALAKVDLVSVGGKNDVLNVLAWFRDHGGDPGNLFGLVDRDEWDQEAISYRSRELPQLRVNEQRHSLESYFCDPAELRPALKADIASQNKTRLDALVTQIRKALADRVKHWCLFTVTERVKNRLGDAQFPGVFHDQYVLPSDREVKKRLKTWSSIVNGVAIFAEFDQLRSESSLMSESERFRSCVWAKPFFEQVVCGGAHGLQSVKSTSVHTWMIDLATSMDVPRDLAPILGECLA